MVEAKSDQQLLGIQNHRNLMALFEVAVDHNCCLRIKFERIIPCEKDIANHNRFRQRDWQKMENGRDNVDLGGTGSMRFLQRRRKLKRLPSVELTCWKCWSRRVNGISQKETWRGSASLSEKLDAMQADKQNRTLHINKKILETYKLVFLAYWHAKVLFSVC